LTIEKSLEILSKNTKTECEKKYRDLIMSLNGLAGLNILEEKYDDAIKIYENVLKSEKELDFRLTIDTLQKVHALHNLNDVFVTFKKEPSKEDLLKQVSD
jgi:E3 ubiquitin-protein ligase SHPRH